MPPTTAERALLFSPLPLPPPPLRFAGEKTEEAAEALGELSRGTTELLLRVHSASVSAGGLAPAPGSGSHRQHLQDDAVTGALVAKAVDALASAIGATRACASRVL